MIQRSLMLFSLLITHVVSAQQASPLSLDQAVETALENNREVTIAKKDVQASHDKVTEYRAIGLPQVNGEISFQNFLDIPTQVIPANAFNPMADPNELVGVRFGTDYNATASITVNQLLFDGSYITGLKAARRYPEISNLQLIMKKRDLKFDVTSAYLSAVIAQENIRIVSVNIDTTERLLEQLAGLIEVGVSDSTEYDQLTLNLQRIKNSKAQAERQYELSLMLLKLVMGVELDKDIELSMTFNDLLEDLGANPRDIQGFDPAQRTEHKLMETQMELKDLDLQVQKNMALPSVGAFFQHQQQALRNEFNFFNDDPWYPATIWGISVQVPIWSSFDNKSKIAQKQIEVEKTQEEITLLDRNLQLIANQSLINYQSAVDVFLTEKDNLALSEKILNRHLIQYRLGVINSITLTQIQQQHLAAQSSYIRAAMDLVNASVELDKILYNPNE